MANVSIVAKNIAGSTTSTATPAAPNVLSTSTAVLQTAPLGNGVGYTFGGTINLPSGTHSQYSEIAVYVIPPSGAQVLIATVINIASDSFAYAGRYDFSLLLGTGTQTCSVVFEPYNLAGQPTASPTTLSGISVPAVGVSALVGSEVGLWSATAGGQLQATLSAAITVSNAGTYSLFTKGSISGTILHGTFVVPAGASAITVGAQNSKTAFFAPTTGTDSVVFVAIPGSVVWQSGVVDPATITGALTSAAFNVLPPAANSTMASNCYADTIVYPKTTGGASLWSLPNMYATFQRVSAGVPNPNFAYARLYCIRGTGTGAAFVPLAGLTPSVITDDNGGPLQISTYGSGYGSAGNSVDVTNIQNWGVPSDNATFRFYWKAASRQSTTVGTWTATEVQQTGWITGGAGTPYVDGGGLQWYDVVVDVNQAKVQGAQVSGTVPSATTAASVPVTGIPYGPLFSNVAGQLALNVDPTYINTAGSNISLKPLAVSILTAGTAYFGGTATFAYSSSGSYCQIGAGAAVFGDNYGAPTTTLSVMSSGMTLSKIISGTPAWAAGTTYSLNALVTRLGNQFVSVWSGAGNQNKDPLIYTAYWQPSNCVMMTPSGVAIYGTYNNSIIATGSVLTLNNATLTAPAINGGTITGTSLTIVTPGTGGTITINTATGGMGCTYGAYSSVVTAGCAVFQNGTTSTIITAGVVASSSVGATTLTAGSASADGTGSAFYQNLNLQSGMTGTYSGPIAGKYLPSQYANVGVTYLYTYGGGTPPAGLYQVCGYMAGTQLPTAQLVFVYYDGRATATLTNIASTVNPGTPFVVRLSGTSTPYFYTTNANGSTPFDLTIMLIKIA